MGRVRILVIVLSYLAFVQAGRAETINAALARAYRFNPQLNAYRANTRSVDENLPIARKSFLPTVSIQGNAGLLYDDVLQKSDQNNTSIAQQGQLLQTTNTKTTSYPKLGSLVVSLNIFNGFRSINGIDQAEAQIHQSRQMLRNTELTVLHGGAVAYMNVLRDIAIFDLRDDYVGILSNQVNVTKQLLENGNATQTDVFQTEAALAQARQERSNAYVNLQSSIAVYHQQIGEKPGNNLTPAVPLDKLLPKTLAKALQLADADHPLALAARYNEKVSALAVKIYEGQLLPTVDLSGYVAGKHAYSGVFNQQTASNNFTGQYLDYTQSSKQRLFEGGLNVQLNVPLYEGGLVYGQVRQAKEKLTEARFLHDQQVDQIRQSVRAAWAAWQESDRILVAARDQVEKAQATVRGMREETSFGQRTNWDILNAQLVLVNARTAFVISQRDRVVSTYALLAATGQLSGKTLGLNVPLYDAKDHYDGVKNQWIGLDPWEK